MQHILGGLYIHRGKLIQKCQFGWEVESCLDIFRTLNDSRQYINKIEDGTNTKEPDIIGCISYSDALSKLVYQMNYK